MNIDRGKSSSSLSLPNLPVNPTLQDFQRYVHEIELQRGFSDQNVILKCLLLGEEVGELYKAVRKQQHIGVDPNSRVNSIEGELADVFIFLCAIANRFGVDLEKAFIEKEKANAGREWT